MAYSDFTIEKVKQDFRLQIDVENFLSPVLEVQPSDWLVESLRRGLTLAKVIGTEKAKSELIIAPVLIEIHEQAIDRISLFSGKTFNSDASLGLNGICDYLIAKSTSQVVIEAPVIVLVEAKQGDLNLGWGQCVAEMVAAQKFNQAAGTEVVNIYGSVTNGTQWQFLQLREQHVLIDPQEYPILPVSGILGILSQLIDNC